MIDWNEADAWLKAGRKKYIRPMYDRYYYLWRVEKYNPASDIGLSWSSGCPYIRSGSDIRFMTLHVDGTATLQGIHTNQWGTHNYLSSQSVKLTLSRYAGIEVIQRNFKFYILEKDAGLTPPKIQNCRVCKSSGLVDKPCWSTRCYDVVQEEKDTLVCNVHTDYREPFDDSQSFYLRFHTLPCEHGKIDAHYIPKGQECYSCNGTGKRDYGSQRIRTPWTGDPIKVRDGRLIKTSTQTLIERIQRDRVQLVTKI